ncbi:hypothetical protein Hanom_Chr09g00839081 [Helianthus anomalus]
MFFTKSFGNFFHLKIFGKNGLQMDLSDVEIDEIARKGLDAAAHDQQSMKGLVCKLYMFIIFILQLITSLDIWIVIYTMYKITHFCCFLINFVK